MDLLNNPDIQKKLDKIQQNQEAYKVRKNLRESLNETWENFFKGLDNLSQVNPGIKIMTGPAGQAAIDQALKDYINDELKLSKLIAKSGDSSQAGNSPG